MHIICKELTFSATIVENSFTCNSLVPVNKNPTDINNRITHHWKNTYSHPNHCYMYTACISCGSIFSLVWKFSNQLNFCFSVSRIYYHNLGQRKTKIKLVWKFPNQRKICTTTYIPSLKLKLGAMFVLYFCFNFFTPFFITTNVFEANKIR